MDNLVANLLVGEVIPGEVLLVVKLMVVLGLLMYLAFAGLVIRQVEMMISSVQEEVLPLPIRAIAWIHFGCSLAILGLALVV